MSEKVVLTKKVADALEIARKRGDEEVIEVIFDSENSYVSEETKILNEFDRMALVHALMNGYEVEETPEDRVKDIFDHALRNKDYSDYYLGQCEGIKIVAHIYGIKIAGVNDK
jgi:arginine deiminase